jgi:hypothetical protein
MTIVLPLGGADFSGVVMLIFVGSDVYAWRAVAAALVELEPDELEVELGVELALVELGVGAAAGVFDEDDLDDPHAAIASTTPNVPRIVANPRTRRLPRFRLWGPELCVMSSPCV